MATATQRATASSTFLAVNSSHAVGETLVGVEPVEILESMEAKLATFPSEQLGTCCTTNSNVEFSDLTQPNRSVGAVIRNRKRCGRTGFDHRAFKSHVSSTASQSFDFRPFYGAVLPTREAAEKDPAICYTLRCCTASIMKI